MGEFRLEGARFESSFPSLEGTPVKPSKLKRPRVQLDAEEEAWPIGETTEPNHTLYGHAEAAIPGVPAKRLDSSATAFIPSEE
jgi:hypothetical protein